MNKEAFAQTKKYVEKFTYYDLNEAKNNSFIDDNFKGNYCLEDESGALFKTFDNLSDARNYLDSDPEKNLVSFWSITTNETINIKPFNYLNEHEIIKKVIHGEIDKDRELALKYIEKIEEFIIDKKDYDNINFKGMDGTCLDVKEIENNIIYETNFIFNFEKNEITASGFLLKYKDTPVALFKVTKLTGINFWRAIKVIVDWLDILSSEYAFND